MRIIAMFIFFVYKALFLTAFYSFLRISNFVPVAVAAFDCTRQLTVNNVIWAVPGAHLIIKWSKVLQSRDRLHVVQIPTIKDLVICPVLALSNMLAALKFKGLHPLFCFPNGQPLTQYNVRQALALITNNLSLPKGFITFHSFRRSGATFAFNHNVSLQNIQAHGGWKSSAIWHYLNHTHKAAGVVARTFQKLL